MGNIGTSPDIHSFPRQNMKRAIGTMHVPPKTERWFPVMIKHSHHRCMEGLPTIAIQITNTQVNCNVYRYACIDGMSRKRFLMGRVKTLRYQCHIHFFQLYASYMSGARSPGCRSVAMKGMFSTQPAIGSSAAVSIFARVETCLAACGRHGSGPGGFSKPMGYTHGYQQWGFQPF